MTTNERAAEIRNKAKAYGLSVTAHNQIVSVIGRFEPHDKDAFNKTEANAHKILRMFKQVRAGSTWGTEGVGGQIALENGRIILSMSGVEKLLARQFYAS